MNNLKKLRNEKKITLHELSRKTNIHYGTLSNLELEKSSFNNDYLKILTDFFDVSSDYLLGFTEIRERADSLKYIPLYNTKNKLLGHLPLIEFSSPSIRFMEDLIYMNIDFEIIGDVRPLTLKTDDVLLLRHIKSKNDLIENGLYFIIDNKDKGIENRKYYFGFTVEKPKDSKENFYIFYIDMQIKTRGNLLLGVNEIGNDYIDVYQIILVFSPLQ